MSKVKQGFLLYFYKIPVLDFHPFPELKTERLLLRQLVTTDAPEIFMLRSDESVNEFLDRPLANTEEDALNFINKINTGIAGGKCIFWAVVPKAENKLAGTICLWNIDEEKEKAEIGYELLPVFQGRGIMQEAIPAVISFGFSDMRLKTIDAWLHRHNLRSIKILENNHFIRDLKTEESMIRGNEGPDTIVYTLNKADYSVK